MVRLDQPYRNYAVDLLSPKFFPKDAGEPYDDISWELPANYHLAAIASADPAVREAPLSLLTERPHAAGRIAGQGSLYVLADTGQEGLLEARFRLSRFKLEIAEQPFSAGGREYPRGSWIFAAQPGLDAALAAAAADLGLDFQRLAAAPHARHARGSGASSGRVGALGGYRQHRLGALCARPAPHSLHLRSR